MADSPVYLPVDVSGIPGIRVHWAEIYDTLDNRYHDEDLAWIELGNGYAVDAGWYGWDDGAFGVWVVKGNDWENPVELHETRDPRECVRLVEAMARKYAAIVDMTREISADGR
jgi:hypothetical protein